MLKTITIFTKKLHENNLERKHSLVIQFSQIVILQQKKFYQKILQNMLPGN